jgi:nanoRNase/pAp phosphatase (c-di-AMP/oligoRNAs hydrolase)
MKQFPIQQLKNLLDENQSIVIFLPKKLVYDQIAAALALFLSFKEQGKNVSLCSEGELIVDFSHLVGLNRIKSNIGDQNLVVSLVASPDSIEKVSYQIENNRFDLVIQPKSGFQAPDPSTVNFSHHGTDSKLFFLFGVQNLADLGALYQDHQELFDQANLVTLGNTSPTFTPAHDLTDLDTPSAVETTTQFMQQLNLPVNQDIATNLMLGLQRVTNNFQALKTTVDSFHAASVLLQAGAKRESSPPHPAVGGEDITPLESVERAPATTGESLPRDSEIPSDWLKPKIFKP